MRLGFFALALTLPAVSSAEAPAAPAPGAAQSTQAQAPPRAAGSFVPSRICRDELRVREARSPDAAKSSRLGELPPGDLTLTVMNRVGDCIEPVVVREGYGALDSRPGR